MRLCKKGLVIAAAIINVCAAQFSNASAASDNTVHQMLISGQSLSIGQAGQPALSVNPSANHLMFRALHWPNYSYLSPLRAWVVETIASGLAEGVNAMQVNASQPPGHRMLISLSGLGAKTINELNRAGGDPHDVYFTGIFSFWVGNQLVVQQGNEYRPSGIAWLQGESDELANTPSEEYRDALIQLQKDYESDVRNLTGWTGQLPLFTYQTNALYLPGQEPSDIPLAQLQASDQSPDIYMVTPIYPFEYADGLHLNNHGYRHLGGYFAKAYKRVVVDQQEWMPLRPLSAQADGRTINVEFQVPVPPLQIDTRSVSNPGDYGFVVEDEIGKILIRKIYVSAPSQVQIVLSRSPLGEAELRYAYDGMPFYDLYGNTSNKYLGARGNLRDSDSTTGFGLNAAGQPYSLPNWCVAFKMEITPDESRKGGGRP